MTTTSQTQPPPPPPSHHHPHYHPHYPARPYQDGGFLFNPSAVAYPHHHHQAASTDTKRVASSASFDYSAWSSAQGGNGQTAYYHHPSLVIESGPPLLYVGSQSHQQYDPHPQYHLQHHHHHHHHHQCQQDQSSLENGGGGGGELLFPPPQQPQPPFVHQHSLPPLAYPLPNNSPVPLQSINPVPPIPSASSSPTLPPSSLTPTPTSPSATTPSFGPTAQVHPLFFCPNPSSSNALLPSERINLGIQLNPSLDQSFLRIEEGDWACYRRNYFELSASFDLIASTPTYIPHRIHAGTGRENGTFVVALEGDVERTLSQFYICLQALSSNGNREVPLFQHTSKRYKGPVATPGNLCVRPNRILYTKNVASGNSTAAAAAEDNVIIEDGGIEPMDSYTSSLALFQRLQFGAATANNGRHRCSQHYHVLIVTLYGECLGTGETVRLACCESAPLIVRGRSPGHYAAADRQRQREASTVSADGEVVDNQTWLGDVRADCEGGGLYMSV